MRSIRYRPLLWKLLGLMAFLLAAPAWAEETSTPAAKEESWDVIYLGDSRVGYARSTTMPVVRDGQKLIRSETEMHMVIKRFGQALKITMLETYEETADGDVVSFSMSMNNPPFSSMKSTGIRSGDQLNITTEIAGKKSHKKVAWDPEAKSPAYQQRLLEEQPLKPGETRTIKVFTSDSLQFSTVDITAIGEEKVKLLDGKLHNLMKVASTMTLPGGVKITSDSYLDKEGATLRTTLPMAGLTMSMFRVEKSAALKELAGDELDLGISTLVKVPRIKNAHQASKVVYSITMPGEDPAQFLIAGETQKIEKTTDPEVVTLSVTQAAKPKSGDSKTAAVDDDYTLPTPFLQSDDPTVAKHARLAVGDEQDAWKKALLLEQYVHQKLTKKNFSTAMASAAEVAANLEGDCTEHAVLLAAMARAAGIPSRIAAGLVYVDRLSSFGGHMWTEVYVAGHWIPLDATLGAGGIGGGHIKLSETSMADDAGAPITALLPMMTALAKIKIEVIDVEHAR
ncbi:transglutaminase-like domain-containing protein [Symmachiella dynata]|uniref:transglutaminase-like domain-containing protein n=1 Tax=Symmachiella dynata TaxID=2527995 RepID=UPI0030EE0E09